MWRIGKKLNNFFEIILCYFTINALKQNSQVIRGLNNVQVLSTSIEIPDALLDHLPIWKQVIQDIEQILWISILLSLQQTLVIMMQSLSYCK